MSGYDWAYDHDVLNRAIALLQQARLVPNRKPGDEINRILPRASWLATLLANSASHNHRRKSLLFAALAKQVLAKNADVEALCYTVFARTGSLPAAMHLTQIVAEDYHYVGPRLGPLSDEFAAAFKASYSEDAGGILLTEFQRRTSDGLAKSDAGVISAPTSAGKSFIVHQYVKQQLRSGNFVALFIVPTKALIAQTCAVYRRFAVKQQVEISVLSSVSEGMEAPKKSMVLALTQERCIRLLSSPVARVLSFIFADEIQSLEDGDRGALLEYVVNELRKLAPTAKTFAAGPFIGRAGELGKALFERDCLPLDTQDSPVSQMVIEISPVKKIAELNFRIINSDPAIDVNFRMAVKNALYSRWRGSQTQAIADSVDLFKGDTPSIVYARGPGTAQNWANEYAKLFDPIEKLSTEINDLIDFIDDSIHPRCSLIECLKRSIAYHHGGLPDFVREEIESLFSDGQIGVLFCTSTLLEGVNLPAEKIFVVSAKKADEELTPFEFKNLIGRAGRLDQHLCGLVYCIQVPDEEGPNWADSFRDESRKEVKPTVDSRLAGHFEAIRGFFDAGTPINEDGFAPELRSTAIILRSRHLTSGHEMAGYLGSKGLSEEQANALLEALDKIAATFSVPTEVVLKNPYVDPVLQNRLYEAVRAEPDAWKIRHERGFATDFESVFKQLDDIFGIIKEIGPVGDPSIYRSMLISFAKLWIFGRPFREIVTRAIPSKIRNDPNITSSDVDRAIKKAMDIVTRDIGFVSAKYFSVLSEMLKALVSEDDLGIYAVTLALPVMLESGCRDPRALALIVACVPRAAAIRLGGLIPEDVEDPVAWLSANQKNAAVEALPSIYKKILRRTGLWS